MADDAAVAAAAAAEERPKQLSQVGQSRILNELLPTLAERRVSILFTCVNMELSRFLVCEHPLRYVCHPHEQVSWDVEFPACRKTGHTTLYNVKTQFQLDFSVHNE